MAGSEGPRSTRSSGLTHRIVWLPPFLLGLAGATAGEMAAGLLLYSSGGFLRALTVILVTELSALGVGFYTSRRVRATDVDGLRRRWLVSVFSFSAAAVFAGAWGLSAGSAPTPLVQGAGLGLLAALPLFSVGAVLGALSTAGDHDHRETRVRPDARSGIGPRTRPDSGPGLGGTSVRSSVGAPVTAPASFGAAVGLLFTGLYGIPSLQPASIYLFCVVAVSVGALFHGWIVDRRIRILHPGKEEEAPGAGERDAVGEVHWERRVRTTPRSEVRILYVGASVADAAAVDDASAKAEESRGVESNRREKGRDGLRVCLPWQRQVLEVVDDRILRGKDRNRPVLMVGVGTGALLSALESRGYPEIVAFEPLGSLIPPWGDGTGESRPSGRSIHQAWHEVESWQSKPTRGYGTVVVNLRLLPRDDSFHAVDRALLERILAARARDGIAFLGGLGLRSDRAVSRTLDWLDARCGGSVSLFRPEAGTWSWPRESWDDLVASLHDSGGGIVTCVPPAATQPGSSGSGVDVAEVGGPEEIVGSREARAPKLTDEGDGIPDRQRDLP